MGETSIEWTKGDDGTPGTFGWPTIASPSQRYGGWAISR